MARTVDEIKQTILDAKDGEPDLSGLNSPSSTAVFNLWAYITAVAINAFEQLLDLATEDLEELARDAISGTEEWLQKRFLEFQYDASNPQVITVTDGAATYPVVDESLRIITRAAVKTQSNGKVQVKVAKGDTTLEPLDTSELNALIGYIDKIGFAGVAVDTVSLNADRFQFQGEIFYSGEYVDTTVKQSVIDAINTYLVSVSVDNFNGQVIREQLIDDIQAVEGVEGIDTLNVVMIGRPEQSVIGDSDNVVIQRVYETAAGYIIEEDTAGFTFDDTITMTLN